METTVTALTQHAFFLTSGGRPLSATFFAPDKICGAVLFVPPFCEERKGALPVFVQTARALAERQVAALLFDFAGCGDSAGDFETVPPETFEADCESAWGWLKQVFPSVPCAVLGLRTGALLAARLAARHPDTAALGAWSPVTGDDFIRQLLQRRMVNDMVAYGKARESRATLEDTLRLNESSIDLDGYLVTGSFCAWLRSLTPLPIRAPALVFSGGHDGKTRAAFAALSQNTQCPETRYPPFWNTVGHVDLAGLTRETAAWLAAQLSQGRAAPDVPATPLPSPCVSCAGAELLTLPGTAAVRAILDTPSAPPHAGALFLHGWSGDRTGPHRLFTRFARQLAPRGFLCLRPDFTGRGLSDGEASDASISGMAENAQTALDALRERLPPGAPVVVIAICSGCKVAVTLAANNPSLSRLLLWSPESMGSLRSAATGSRKTWGALATYTRKLLRPETWKKLLSGNVQAGLVAKALVKHETRSAEEALQEDVSLGKFRTFRNPVLLVFGGSDPDAAGSGRAYARYCRTFGIPYDTHTVPHAGHSYYSETWTDELFDVSLRFLS